MIVTFHHHDDDDGFRHMKVVMKEHVEAKERRTAGENVVERVKNPSLLASQVEQHYDDLVSSSSSSSSSSSDGGGKE